MDPLALALIAVAAVMHATWNILLKSSGDSLWTATVGVVAATVLFAPPIALAWWLNGQPAVPLAAWGIAMLSGAAEVAYFVFLAAAYRRGDLSVIYPLARGTAPVIAVGVGVGILGERLSAESWLGVALLIGGLVVVQRPWRLLTMGGHHRSGAAFALLTGTMIATYTSFDRVGVQLAPAWVYAEMLWLPSAAGLLVVAWLRPRIAGGRYAAPDVPLDVPKAVLGGVLTFSAYFLVLAALSLAPLAIIAPLRESAVLLASTWAIVRLREVQGRREIAIRLAGSALVLAGAVVLAAGR